MQDGIEQKSRERMKSMQCAMICGHYIYIYIYITYVYEPTNKLQTNNPQNIDAEVLNRILVKWNLIIYK